MDKLLSCPFCGGTDILMRDVSGMFGRSSHARTYHYMQCRDCFSQTGYHETKTKAIDAWNTRTPIECKQSEPISFSHEKGGEWISVDERLPEQCIPVLVYKNSNSEAYGNMETAYFEKGRWRGSCGEFITHWMPLPKAPQMKGGKQE